MSHLIAKAIITVQDSYPLHILIFVSTQFRFAICNLFPLSILER